MKKTISIILAVLLIIPTVFVTAFADTEDFTQWYVNAAYAGSDSDGSAAKPFTTLEAANAVAAEGDKIIVDSALAMAAPISFTNKVTIELTSNAHITYTSDNNSRVTLITLPDGGVFNMAAGSVVEMLGTGTQNGSRDWRAIFSTGDLITTHMEGRIYIENAKGRAFYGTNNAIFNCDMAGDFEISNPNGDNRYLFVIQAYNGKVIINGNLTGSIKAYFGGGNTCYGIYANTGVEVNGDISGNIDVQTGVSHNGMAIRNDNGSVIVTGDISGSIYARAGSGSG